MTVWFEVCWVLGLCMAHRNTLDVTGTCTQTMADKIGLWTVFLYPWPISNLSATRLVGFRSLAGPSFGFTLICAEPLRIMKSFFINYAIMINITTNNYKHVLPKHHYDACRCFYLVFTLLNKDLALGFKRLRSLGLKCMLVLIVLIVGATAPSAGK